MRGRRFWSVALVGGLVAALGVVIGPATPAAAASQALTLGYDQKVYGDFILAGNAVLVCPSGDTTCLAGANDTTGTNTAANDNFAMVAVGADTANGVFDSSTVQVTIPPGAKVAYAQLMWSGSTGLYGTNTQSTCGPQGPASRPTAMAANATPSNTPVRLTVGSNPTVSVSGSRLTTDTATAGQQQFYSGSANVTSAFANVVGGAPLTIKAANVYAYQGYACQGGWSIAVVYDFGQPNDTYAPGQKEVFIYDGHLRVAAGTPASATITGFRANGPARVGMVAYEGDNSITGDTFSINGTNQPEPRTGKTDNFFISNADNRLSPNYPNNYSVDAKTINVPTTVIKNGDTSASLGFGTTGDTYLAEDLIMSIPIPDLKITKTVSPLIVHAGDTLTYTITVRNPTAATASSVVVADPLVPACNKTIGTMIGLATLTYTCTAAASATGGTVTNIANVSGKSAFNDGITGTANASVQVLAPAVTISKTADAAAYHVGDPVTFTVSVNNTGNTDLYNVAVADAKTASCVRTIGTLAAGTSRTYTCAATAPITGDSNTAVVTGVDQLALADGDAKGRVTATSTAPAPTIHPALALVKTASPTTVTAAGQSVTYSFKVTNTSPDAPVTGVAIKDTLTAPASPEPTITCPSTSLAVGASTTCTGVYTVTQADLDKGTIHNSATATATDQVGSPVTSPAATADVTATRTPALSLTKSADPASISAIGANVSYRFTVKNTGNVTATALTVNDVFTSPATDIVPTVTCPATTLAPGASTICTASYASVPADFDNGSINNSATASATTSAGAVTSNVSLASVVTVQGPALTLVKSATPATITAPGPIAYRFAVTNSGTVTVRNLVINDAFTGPSAGDPVPVISCPVTTLAAGASTICTATYNATQADIDNGAITNSATANGTAPSGASVASAQSQATVTATRTSALTLAKTVNPTTATKAGDSVTYTFAVTNSGNTTMTALMINDPKFPGAATPVCLAITLAPGGSTTCTKTYLVTQGDVDAGSITNTATALGTGPGNTAVQSPSSTARVSIAAAAHLSLVKTANPTVVTAAGQHVTYSFTVTNDGNVSVSSLAISDALAPPARPALTISCPQPSVAPGASVTCSAVYTVTAADVDNGTISNSATASGTTPASGPVTSAASTATVTATAAPALTLVKTATPQTISSVGQSISYSFAVLNSGNTTLAGLTINDPQLTAISCPVSTLAAGASTTCSGSYVSTQADLDRGSILNSATATGTSPTHAPVTSPTSRATVTVTQKPSLSLQKSATPAVVAAVGDRVTYTFAVQNTGNVTLSTLAVNDTLSPPAGPALNPISCAVLTLAPGASTSCTAGYTVAVADLDNGSIGNSATVTATGPGGGIVTSNPSTATVAATAAPKLSLLKTVTPTTAAHAGDVVTYTFAVTNSGNQTVSALAIEDRMFTGAAAASCLLTALAPGGSTTCSARYTATQADVDAGTIVNTATASGTAPGAVPVTSNQSSAQVSIAAAPRLAVAKTATPTTITTPGEKINYSFAVTNTGNLTLSAVTILDTFTAPAGPLDVPVSCPTGELAPGATITCTATYTATQADVDAGSIKNSALASATDPTGHQISSPAATATVTVTQTAAMSLLKGASVAGGGALTTAGQKINYTFAATNTGNVTLSLLGVQDVMAPPADRPLSVSCPTTTVAVGVTVQCTVSYTVTQDDIDSGSVDNTGTATAHDPNGATVTSNGSTASVAVTFLPGLRLVKNAAPTTVTAAGQSINYSFTLTNSGNVRLHGLGVADAMFPAPNPPTCVSTALDPGASTTCSASHPVTQDDIDSGTILNSAQASGLDPANSPILSNTDTATVTAIATPALTVVKSAAPTSVDQAGQTVTYSFLLTNTGNVTVHGVTVSDARVSAPTCPVSTLAPGASATCTASYPVTLADMNAGRILNTATASGFGPDGAPVTSPPSTATVTVNQQPGLSLVKSVAGGPFTRAGQVITYNFDATNTGNVSVTVLAIVDRLTAPAGPPLSPITCGATTLDPTQTVRCTATYTITQADVDSGSVNNSAFAQAEDPSHNPLVSPSSTASVQIAPAPVLSVTKSASPTTVAAAGQRVVYSFVTTNNGNVTLSLLAVQDTLSAPAAPEISVTCPSRTLAPGESATCTGSYTVTQADMDAGSLGDVANATAQTPDGLTITSPPSNPVTVAVTQNPILTIDKSVSRSTVTAAGQLLDYTFRVTNAGNVSVNSIAVDDPMFVDPIAPVCPQTTLAPGASTTCTASYRTTQADLDAGSIVNTASAVGAGPTGATVTSVPDTVTVTATQRAHVSLTKAANPQSITEIGTTINYSFIVLNDGNLTLTELSVSDPMFLEVRAPSCPLTTLLPGQSTTCSASYVTTPADFDHGQITNTAAADGTTVAGAVSSNPSTATVTADQTAALDLIKAASPSAVSSVGETITYTFQVINAGNVTMNSLAIDDPMFTGPATPQCLVSTLAAEASTTCTATHTVTQSDLDAASGKITNTAAATGVPAGGGTSRSSDATANVTVLQAPALTVDKNATPMTITAPGPVSYTFQVSNTGNVTVDAIAIDDRLIPGATCLLSSLAPGAATTCTGTYPATQADVDRGSITNTARAAGAGPAGTPLESPPDSVTVTATRTPALTLAKSITSPLPVTTVGQLVQYALVLSNTGNVTITAPRVTDSLTAPAGPPLALSCPAVDLAPSASLTCTANYVVTQSDVEQGLIDNSATASGTGPTGASISSNPSTATAAIAQTSGLVLSKTADPAAIAQQGERITYTFAVTNTGNTSVRDLQLVDAMTAPAHPTTLAVNCPATTLGPAGSATATVICTARYVATQADADHGRIDNTALASGVGPSGARIDSNASPATVTIAPAPSLQVLKSASPATVSAVGERIDYTFAVTNTGNLTLSAISVADGWTTAPDGDAAPTVSCPSEPLAPNTTITCTAAHTLTQADLDLGRLSNSATATGTPPTGDAVTSVPSPATVTVTQRPALSLVKSADPRTVAAVGSTVDYSFLVTNTGNVTVSTLAITDTFDDPDARPLGPITCPVTTLAPAAATTCTASYAVTQADLDRGVISNTATAGARDSNGNPVTSPASAAAVAVTQAPALTLVKSVSPSTATRAGDVVTYSFLVTNTGNLTLSALAIDDTLTAPAQPALTITCPVTTLAPAASTTCTAPYLIGQVDVDHGQVVNSAIATAVNPAGAAVRSDRSSATVTIAQVGSLTLTKSASPTTVTAAGQRVSYTFLVTNNTNVTVTNLAVDDTFTAPAGPVIAVSCPTAPLAPGATASCTAPYPVTQDDLDHGSITNSATVSGSTPSGTRLTSPSSSAAVTADQSPMLTIMKSASPTVVGAAGAAIDYSFLVTNTGNVTVRDLTVTDVWTDAAAGDAPPTVTCPATTLAPNAVTACTARYLVRQADVDHGVLANAATATGTPPTGPATTSEASPATVTVTQQPALTLAKSAAPGAATRAGDVVTYSFLVTNTGNVTIDDVAIQDTFAVPAGPALEPISCPTVRLAPAESTTCTASYSVTQTDADHGTIANTATVTGQDPTGTPVTSAPSSAGVTIAAQAALSVVKSASPTVAERAGTTVTYSFLVTNTGNVTLHDVGVVDEWTTAPSNAVRPVLSCPATTLVPAQTLTCTASYTVTQADVDSGTLINSAVASGTAPGTDTPTTSDPSSATVMTNPSSALTLVKSASPRAVSAVGTVITYTFVVTNTGNVTVSGVVIQDPRLPGAGAPTCSRVTLSPGQRTTCSARYAVTPADLDSGAITNTATADGQVVLGIAPVSPPSSATVVVSGGGILDGSTPPPLPTTGVQELGPVIGGGVGAVLLGVLLLAAAGAVRRRPHEG